MFRLILFHFGAALLAFSIGARAADPEQSLRDQYAGKIFMLRDSHPGHMLNYDSATGLRPKDGGDWTTDGLVRVDEIHLVGNTLKIKGTRQIVVSAGQKGFEFAGEKLVRKTKNHGMVEIQAELSNDSLTDANAILSKLFLTSQDKFVDFVPDYWRACITEGLSGKNDSCRFSSEISSVPGMASQTQGVKTGEGAPSRNSSPASGAIAANPQSVTRVGGPVKPPLVVHSPEPPYSESAQKMEYYGVVTLQLVVNREGAPEEINIVNPLGAGLDANAVRTVARWRFKPAQKNGQPVAVRIKVEVDFHHY